MSGDAMCEGPRRHNADKIRVHDYLYDPAFIVSGARDYARMAFKAAMASAQVVIQPVYNSMFSEMRLRPRNNVVYHPNCRVPDHIDRSYGGYLNRMEGSKNVPTPQFSGKDQFRFTAAPKRVLPMPKTTPEFHPTTPTRGPIAPSKPRCRGTQSIYRESSAQTIPWQPDGKPSKKCEKTPEVMYLEKLEWGPGRPFRSGDLPADFHTTEIINKMRHARVWMDLVENSKFPRWMKKGDAIIKDVETKDWLFRQAEIDELQDIRLELLHRLQTEQRQKQTNRTSMKLAKLWSDKKQEMERKIDRIRKTRDRELRKMVALHEGGGRAGMVARLKAARGADAMPYAAINPKSDMYAPLLRHGYQARRRHAEIIYDPTLLSLEDHKELAEPPSWLESCGQDLKKTCSGHHLPRDPTVLCERQTKWSEQFLENLHNDLKKARLGAAKMGAGPLHILQPRKDSTVQRPLTPEVESVDDLEETSHQSALILQRIIRGRAVQNLMYEGRTRAAELTEELKTTHALQKEDKYRISREESKAREFNARRTETEQKDDAITALVDELCGGAVSAALDFLEKELRRLKEERRQHAFLIIAVREKTMREAAEAGRRQKEEHRRREHDEMFKQILGVTQETVDAYLREIISEGVEIAAEGDAMTSAKAEAKRYQDEHIETLDLTTTDTNEMVADLVQQFLLPHAHKMATRHRIAMQQNAKLEAARKIIFKLIEDADTKEEFCVRCGRPLDEQCCCRFCPFQSEPVESDARHSWRWKYSRLQPKPPVKSHDEKFPLEHDMRCMLRDLVNEVVQTSRQGRAEAAETHREFEKMVDERMEITLDTRYLLDVVVDIATGAKNLPVKEQTYRHMMRRIVPDALERTVPVETPDKCPKVLPSEIRRRAEEQAAIDDPTCRCEEAIPEPVKKPRARIQFGTSTDEKSQLLPSDLRKLEELKRCKCDSIPSSSPGEQESVSEEQTMTDYTEPTWATTSTAEETKETDEEGDG